jgi:hypothetical protein
MKIAGAASADLDFLGSCPSSNTPKRQYRTASFYETLMQLTALQNQLWLRFM